MRPVVCSVWKLQPLSRDRLASYVVHICVAQVSAAFFFTFLPAEQVNLVENESFPRKQRV